MQGFILRVTPVRDEDLLVHIVTDSSLVLTYRFYGVRHSTIQLGYKIDFRLEYSNKSTLPMLKDVIHLGFPWITNTKRVILWQQYIKLFYKHLKDNETIDNIYFDQIEQSALIWHLQNPKRVAIEHYLQILSFEGRLNNIYVCFLCDKPVKEQVTIARSFLPTHPECNNGIKIDKKTIIQLFETKSTIMIDDNLVDHFWQILLKGF